MSTQMPEHTVSEQVLPDELLDVVVLELLELALDALVEPPEPVSHPRQGP